MRCRTARWSVFNVSYFIELQIRDTPPTKTTCSIASPPQSPPPPTQTCITIEYQTCLARANVVCVPRRHIGCGGNDELRTLCTEGQGASSRSSRASSNSRGQMKINSNLRNDVIDQDVSVRPGPRPRTFWECEWMFTREKNFIFADSVGRRRLTFSAGLTALQTRGQYKNNIDPTYRRINLYIRG